MTSTYFVTQVEKKFQRNNFADINIGDLVKIGLQIQDGAKKRVQYFEGRIIGQNKDGIKTNIIVRQILQNIGVERNIFLHSPSLVSISVLRSFKAKKSKLYFIRNRSKKNIRLKQNFKKSNN